LPNVEAVGRSAGSPFTPEFEGKRPDWPQTFTASFNSAVALGLTAAAFATFGLRADRSPAQANCFFKSGLERIAPDSDLPQHGDASADG
jgi:hypothetical protein